MHQQENQTLTKPAYKLSGNNSLLTLSDGSKFEINIEGAILQFMGSKPQELELPEIRTEILGTLDEFTENMPNDFPMGRYKNIYAQLNAYAVFFDALFRSKGGDHE